MFDYEKKKNEVFMNRTIADVKGWRNPLKFSTLLVPQFYYCAFDSTTFLGQLSNFSCWLCNSLSFKISSLQLKNYKFMHLQYMECLGGVNES